MTKPKYRMGEPYGSGSQVLRDVMDHKPVYFNGRIYTWDFMQHWSLSFFYRYTHRFVRAIHTTNTKGTTE
jgi:hypothetical protein